MSDSRPRPGPPDDAAVRAAFIAGQVTGLEPYGFLSVALAEPPFDSVNVCKGEDGTLTLEVADRDPGTPFAPDQLAGLSSLGFTLEGGTWVGPELSKTPEAVSGQVERTLAVVFGVGCGSLLDITHGSRRQEAEAEAKVEEMRRAIEPVLSSIVGQVPPRDGDGDYLVDIGSTRVFVAPRARPGGPPTIRVFSITNAGLQLTPDLGLFLGRLNFNLMFGRFSIDTDHQAIWLDETLLGDHVTDEELRFIVEMVAATAGEWDQKIAQIFGGTVRQRQLPAETTPPSKPGQGGYL